MAENITAVKKYKLENLSCANCAADIESAVQKMEGVRFAQINFAAGSLQLEADDLDAVRTRIQQIEPQVRVLEEDHPQETHDPAQRRDLIQIGSALVLFLAGLGLSQLLNWADFSLGAVLLFGSAYMISGSRVLIRAIYNLRAGNWFDETFLMSISTLGAVAIGELPEAVGVMLFYTIGEYVQNRSVSRSRKMIKALMDVRPDRALVLAEDGTLVERTSESVLVGEVIAVRPGDRVALDGVVLEGQSQIDASMLTGESMPVAVGPESEVFAGTVNQGGLLKVQVTKPLESSSVSRMMELVQNAAHRKARTEQFITRFAKVYSPIMVGLAAAVAVIPPLVVPGASFQEWLYRALILLVISCPCALVISIPLGYFGGIGGASRKGILVKGANYLDVLAKVRTVIFDKTGTLTHGTFKVTQITPEEGVSELELLSLAAQAESHSSHPLAESIKQAYHALSGQPSAADVEVLESFEEVAGFGIKAKLNGYTILIGNDAILHRENVLHTTCDVPGTVVHVARNGRYQGFLVVSDQIKAEVSDAVARLHAAGVEHITMLSGDQEDVAARVAESAGLDDYKASLLPAEKVEELEKILARSEEGTVAYVGDGINDAPALARADVGIAMGAFGTDAARETADVVLMTDSISRVADAIELGKRTRRIVWQNIGMALGIKLVFILLGVAGEATMWEAVFADVGVTVLAVLNASRVMR